MKTLNFNFKLKDLSGKDIKDYDVKENVANLLAGASTKKPVKMMEIARKIHKTGKVELTSEDAVLVEQAIIDNGMITDLVKEQLLNAIK